MALALGFLLIAGCASPTGPGTSYPFVLPPGGSGGGGSGGGTTSALFGTWRVTLVFQVGGDVQTTTTTWTLRADDSCRRVKESTSLLEGITRTTTLDCTWTTGYSTLTVRDAVTGASSTYPYSFPTLSADILRLDGFDYQRVG